MLPESGPGGSIDQLGLTAPLDCVPEGLRSTLERGHDLFPTSRPSPTVSCKLITRRTSHMINSALQNVEKLKARGAGSNPLWMHPDDAQRLGLADGRRRRGAQRRRRHPRRGELDANLRPGVVAMTHGFGNACTSGMPNAQRYPGVNVNLLGPERRRLVRAGQRHGPSHRHRRRRRHGLRPGAGRRNRVTHTTGPRHELDPNRVERWLVETVDPTIAGVTVVPLAGGVLERRLADHREDCGRTAGARAQGTAPAQHRVPVRPEPGGHHPRRARASGRAGAPRACDEPRPRRSPTVPAS